MPRFDTASDHAALAERWDALCDLAPVAKRRFTFSGYAALSWEARCALEAELLGHPVYAAPEPVDGPWFAAVIVVLVVVGAALAALIQYAL